MKSLIHKLGVVGIVVSFSLSIVSPALAETSAQANLQLGTPAIKGLFNSFNNTVRADLKAQEKKDKEKSKDEHKERSAQIKALEKAIRGGKTDVVASSSFHFALVEGKLVAISGTSLPAELTVEVARSFPGLPAAMITDSKRIAVMVNTDTNIVRRYWGKGSLDQLSVGDSLQIFGQVNDQNKLAALLVKDNSIWLTNHEGIISSIDSAAQTFVLSKAKNATSTTNIIVRVTGSTKLVNANKTAVTFADLKVNARVHVSGIFTADTRSTNALTVKMQTKIPAPADNPRTITRGTVSSVDSVGSMLVLKTAEGTYFLVTLLPNATITIPGVVSPSLANLKAVDHVAVTGKVNQRTNLIEATAMSVE